MFFKDCYFLDLLDDKLYHENPGELQNKTKHHKSAKRIVLYFFSKFSDGNLLSSKQRKGKEYVKHLAYSSGEMLWDSVLYLEQLCCLIPMNFPRNDNNVYKFGKIRGPCLRVEEDDLATFFVNHHLFCKMFW